LKCHIYLKLSKTKFFSLGDLFTVKIPQRPYFAYFPTIYPSLALGKLAVQGPADVIQGTPR